MKNEIKEGKRSTKCARFRGTETGRIINTNTLLV